MNADGISGIFVPFLIKFATPANPPHSIGIRLRAKYMPRGIRESLFLILAGYCVLSINTCGVAQAGDAGAAVSNGGMFQVVLGLGFVLALMGALAWLLRRLGGGQQGGSGAIKIIGGSAVGQRERVVLVEVADTWLVIGVAPGHVTALHSMPKGEISASGGQAGDSVRFPVWLKQTIEKQTMKKQTIEKSQGERNGE